MSFQHKKSQKVAEIIDRAYKEEVKDSNLNNEVEWSPYVVSHFPLLVYLPPALMQRAIRANVATTVTQKCSGRRRFYALSPSKSDHTQSQQKQNRYTVAMVVVLANKGIFSYVGCYSNDTAASSTQSLIICTICYALQPVFHNSSCTAS